MSRIIGCAIITLTIGIFTPALAGGGGAGGSSGGGHGYPASRLLQRSLAPASPLIARQAALAVRNKTEAFDQSQETGDAVSVSTEAG